MTNIWVTATIKIGPIIGLKVQVIQMRAHMLPSLSFLIFHGDVSRRGLFPPIFRPSQGRQCRQCREIHTVVIFKPVRIEQPMQLHFSVIPCTALQLHKPTTISVENAPYRHSSTSQCTLQSGSTNPRGSVAEYTSSKPSQTYHL